MKKRIIQNFEIENKLNFIKQNYNIALSKSSIIGFKKDKDIVYITGLSIVVKDSLGLNSYKETRWQVFKEDDFNLYLIMIYHEFFDVDKREYIISNKIRQWFRSDQMMITSEFDLKKYN